jgi:transposase
MRCAQKVNNPSNKIAQIGMAKKNPTSRQRKAKVRQSVLERINLHAAGIDIGANFHFVAIGEDCTEEPVRKFGPFTSDLHRMADWLSEHHVETVVMESTGVYWIPVFQILEQRGFEVKLVNAAHVKNLPGRKSDVSDCQWLQQLHTFGLLNGSFRPKDEVCVLRSFLRLRDTLVKDCSSQVLRMQKALTEMNVQVHRVLSDITGESGMAIIRAILAGERDPLKLAQMKHPRVKASTEQIVRALEGDYRAEHLFGLQTAVELYDAYQLKILQCEAKVEEHLQQFETQLDFAEVLAQNGALQARSASVRLELQRQAHLVSVCGVDLTHLPGLSTLAVEVIIAETGLDMNCWKSEKHFCSWLKLCPDNRISGGKVLNSKSRKTKNRAAAMFRLAAQGAMQSKTAIGAFIRRIKARLGAPTAINAGAHKLAQLYYRMLKFGEAYVEQGQTYYEEKYKDRLLRNLSKRAKEFGLQLTPLETVTPLVS